MLDKNAGPRPKNAGEHFAVVASAKEIVVTGGRTPTNACSKVCFVYSIEKKT